MKFQWPKPFSIRFLKTTMVGGLATLADLGTLTLMVQGFGFSPQAANLPSLFFGSTVQFLGNRNYVFRAENGHLGKQALGFIAIEAGAFALNALSFYLLVTFTPINYLIARIGGTFLIFAGFSYPLWKKNFRVSPKVSSPASD